MLKQLQYTGLISFILGKNVVLKINTPKGNFWFKCIRLIATVFCYPFRIEAAYKLFDGSLFFVICWNVLVDFHTSIHVEEYIAVNWMNSSNRRYSRHCELTHMYIKWLGLLIFSTRFLICMALYQGNIMWIRLYINQCIRKEVNNYFYWNNDTCFAAIEMPPPWMFRCMAPNSY